jgi:soluble lytic murein transglycosylase
VEPAEKNVMKRPPYTATESIFGRGMMQFISATARDVAAKLNRAAFQQDDLYNPDAAILFGAEYLSSLFKQFPNQPQAVAAAYNGGPDNVARWIARARADDPDRYVPEIGFSQTKDYVYRVMSNFWNYERLYDAQLQRKQVQSK